MTRQERKAEQDAWSRYLDALAEKQAAWTATQMAFRDAVYDRFSSESWTKYRHASDEDHRARDRVEEMRRQWARVAYPMFDIPLDDESADTTAVS